MFFLDLLRAIAIVMITNSHLEPLYPWPILATGGMFGNELFFFISGYGLSLSLDRQQVDFGSWIAKRSKRVYEPLLLATTLLLLIGFYKAKSVWSLIALYSGFLTYWFLPVIVIFYFPLYFVINAARPRLAFSVAATAAMIVYVVGYATLVDPARFDVESHLLSKAPFYFVIMLMGAYAARRPSERRPGWLDLALLMAACGAYLASQFAMRAYSLFAFQFVVHLIGIVWLIAVYSCIRHPGLSRLDHGVLRRVIAFLSSTALQIYLLQEFFIRNARIGALPFPMDVIVFWLAVLSAAWLFKKVSFNGARKFFSRRETGAVTKT